MAWSKIFHVVNKFLVAFFFFVGIPVAAEAAPKSKVIGTFSSFRFNADSGDLNGMEVKIVPTPNGYNAVIQLAEGEPGLLSIVHVIVKDEDVEFDVPLQRDAVGKFKGKIKQSGLYGSIRWPSEIESVRLLRGKSYWDR